LKIFVIKLFLVCLVNVSSQVYSVDSVYFKHQ
jgi:hypothetical protein